MRASVRLSECGSSGDGLDDRGVGHAAGLTHRLQAVAQTVGAEVMNESGHQDRAGRSERMPHADGAAERIEMVEFGAGLDPPRQWYRREGLVDLEGIDVPDAQPGALQ